MDTDHSRLFKAGFYLAISISACLCKEPAAAGEDKRGNEAAAALRWAPDSKSIGWAA